MRWRMEDGGWRMDLLALADRGWHLVDSDANSFAKCLPICQAWFSAVSSVTVLADLGTVVLGQDLSFSLTGASR